MNPDSVPVLPLRDFIDIPACRDLLASFTRLTGISTAILTLDGEILAAGPWQDICTRFHRKNPTTALRCLESDTFLAGNGRTEGYTAYQCRNGLIDASVPVLIDGVHAGNLFAGQFFFDPPDRSFFEQQAEKFGFDGSAYLEALSRVPVCSKEKFDAAITLLKNITTIIGNSGFERKKLFVLNQELEKRVLDRTEALKESEARWKFAMEGAGDGLWDWNPKTNQVYFSSQWKKILGYSPEGIGDSSDEWEVRVHPEDKLKVHGAMEKHLRGETPAYQSEHRLRCKDGSYKWVLDRGKVIEWAEDGSPLRVIGTHSDISNRKHAEAEREQLIKDLKTALSEVKTLSGLLPICTQCKKIRNDQGYWEQIETYIQGHSEAMFSHGICRDCARQLYPDIILPKKDPAPEMSS